MFSNIGSTVQSNNSIMKSSRKNKYKSNSGA